MNDYNATYSLDGSSITIGPVATTRKAGPAELMEQESLYLAALQSAATYSLQGDKLELRDAQDAIAVAFLRK